METDLQGISLDYFVPPVPHLADFLPLSWISSKLSMAVLAKRRSIINVVGAALRLRN